LVLPLRQYSHARHPVVERNDVIAFFTLPTPARSTTTPAPRGENRRKGSDRAERVNSSVWQMRRLDLDQ